MKVRPLGIADAFALEVEPVADERGFFTRLWCVDELAAHGAAWRFVQGSLSHNHAAGTVRGMHFQRAPSREGKLVRCQRGRLFDVLLDLRPDSPHFARHVAVELDSRRHNAVFVPPGVAHGFQTLEDDTEVAYLMTDFHRPALADGVRFDDPAFGIAWPVPVRAIAPRDRDYPDFDRDAFIARHRRPDGPGIED